MEIRIIYLTLFILMFICLYYGGKGIRNDNKALIIVGVLAFTLNEGLRFGRWIDYNNYYFFYQDALKMNQTRFSEFLFVYLCRFIDSVGGTYQVLILFMSFMHIVAGVFFVRLYKEVAMYALPFYALFSYAGAENLLRWYLAFSFFLIGFYFYLSDITKRHKYRYFLIASLIGLNIHAGLILVIPLFFIILNMKKTIPPIISIPIFVGLYLFFRVDYMLQFAEIVNSLSGYIGRYSGYADDAERWLTTTSLGLDGQNLQLSLTPTILYSTCVIIGYYLIPYLKNNYLFAYNLFLFGYLLYPIAFRIEILSRIDQLFLLFVSVVLAYILKYVFITKISEYKIISLIFLLATINYARWQLVKPFKLSPEQLLYVWDKHGRNYLDNYTVYFMDIYKRSK